MSEQNTIPREKFVIGEGHYTNWPLLEARATAEAFEIAPVPTPTISLTALGLTILLIGFGMAWFLKEKTSAAMVSFIAVFGVLTAIGTVFAIAANFRSRQKRGCAFRLNQAIGEVALPDRGEVFSADCRFSFVLIESPFYSPSGSSGDTVAELQLVVEKNGVTRRFALAQADSRLTLNPLVDEVRKQVCFPVHEVLHQGLFKSKIIEKDYGTDAT